jgi:hypothetical protein
MLDMLLHMLSSLVMMIVDVAYCVVHVVMSILSMAEGFVYMRSFGLLSMMIVLCMSSLLIMMIVLCMVIVMRIVVMRIFTMGKNEETFRR